MFTLPRTGPGTRVPEPPGDPHYLGANYAIYIIYPPVLAPLALYTVAQSLGHTIDLLINKWDSNLLPALQ